MAGHGTSLQVTAPSTGHGTLSRLQYPQQVTVPPAGHGTLMQQKAASTTATGRGKVWTAARDPLPRQGRNKKLTKTGLQHKSGLRPQVSGDSTLGL